MWSGGGTKRRSQCSGTTGFRDPGGFRDEVRVNSFTDGAVSVSRNPARQMISRGGGRGIGVGWGGVGWGVQVIYLSTWRKLSQFM